MYTFASLSEERFVNLVSRRECSCLVYFYIIILCYTVPGRRAGDRPRLRPAAAAAAPAGSSAG